MSDKFDYLLAEARLRPLWAQSGPICELELCQAWDSSQVVHHWHQWHHSWHRLIRYRITCHIMTLIWFVWKHLGIDCQSIVDTECLNNTSPQQLFPFLAEENLNHWPDIYRNTSFISFISWANNRCCAANIRCDLFAHNDDSNEIKYELFW